MEQHPLRALDLVIGALDSVGIPYFVGGSVASSLYGVQRFTNDVDIVVQMTADQAAVLAAALGSDFYADEEAIRDGVETRTSFSVLHLDTMVKADLFVNEDTAWKQQEWSRRRLTMIRMGENELRIQIASPEDMILQKLLWYRMGGGVSDRQWGDVIGMLKVQADGLDYDYLRHWAEDIGVADLLGRAIEDAS